MDSESDPDICDWKNKYDELWKYNDKVITHYNLLALNEKKLLSKIRELERYNEFNQSELISNYEIIVKEKNDTIKNLSKKLTSTEEELCNIHKKFEYVCNRLRFEFQCQKTEFINPNLLYNKQVKQNMNFEQYMLSSKFKTVCDKLRETKIAYDEAKNMIKNDIFSLKNSVATIEKLVEGEGNNYYNVLALQVQKLKETNDIKDEKLRFMKKKIKKLEQRNEFYVLKIKEQKKKILESELEIKNFQLLETNCDQTNQRHNHYLNSKKKLNNLFEFSSPKCNCINSEI